MNKKMTTVALAAMAMALTTSCSTSKKAQNQVHEGTTSLEVSKGNAENMDPEYPGWDVDNPETGSDTYWGYVYPTSQNFNIGLNLPF